LYDLGVFKVLLINRKTCLWLKVIVCENGSLTSWDLLTLNDSKEWSDLVDNCGLPDIHFTPEYMRIFENKMRTINFTEASLFVKYSQNKKNYALYPFFKRRLTDKPIFSFIKEPLYDIISPWYFGGVLLYSKENRVNLLKMMLNDLREYANQNSIITEFVRVHPLLPSTNDYVNLVNAQCQYDISYINLEQSIEEIWQNFNKANRNAINSAKRKKIDIDFSTSEESLNNFFKLYVETMNRIKADEYYLFSFEYLKQILKNFKNNLIIATARYSDKPIASTMLLLKGGIVHYWLSGSDYNFRNFYPNNLLIFESIKKAKKDGNKIFCLMGGTNESLRKFKASFSKTKTGYYTVSKIYDQKKYDYLLDIRKKKQKIDRLDFFPLYRV